MTNKRKNPSSGEYERWLKFQSTESRRGRTKRLDEFVDDIPALFTQMKLDDLAGCWVAIIVDEISRPGWTLGNVARSLTVVAQRLHGVK